ncbi:hypothetical protein G9A89_022461 [Geosiphon pyriformis]|nr:hypothetical protein G9A89_022461 [Geosiphon pyriformis]
MDTNGEASDGERVSDSKMNTPQAKHFNNGVIIGSPFGSINYDMEEEKEVSFPFCKSFSLDKVWINPKIIKIQVEVAVKKSFTLDIDFSVVEKKLATAKTQVIRKLFSGINGFEGATTPSKFEGIIRSTFTLSESMEKTVSLARENNIIVNSDFKRQGICSDQDIVIKEIPIDMPKKMIITAVSEFGQIKSIKIQLIDGAGGKTYIINYSLETGNRFCCVVVGFVSDKSLESAFHTEPILGGVRLSWARLDLVRCERCGKFGHSALECNAEAQVVSFTLSSNNLHFGFDLGFDFFSSGASSVIGSSSHMVSASISLEAHLASLEHFVELLVDKVSDIVSKLENLVLVPPALTFSFQNMVVPVVANMEINSDITLDDPKLILLLSSLVSSSTSELGSSSSKILTSKVGCLESKLMALEASVCSVLEKLDQMCTGLDSAIATCNIKEMNNPAKQADVICWHKEMDNMISIITETKLKGFGVAIVMNVALVKHVCKISEVPSHLLSVRLLFKNKPSVSVLSLYAGALLLTCFSQASDVNALISKTVNESSFVILGGDFNENDSRKSASFKKCGSLGLVNSLIDNNFLRASTWSNSRGVAKTIDYLFVSSNLVNTIVDRGILDVSEFFDTDHQSISVSVSLGGQQGLLKLKFKEVMIMNAAMFSDNFVAANKLSDLDAILSKFHKLELLVSKLVRAFHSVNNDNFVSLLNTWESLDSDNAVVIRSLFLSGSSFNNIHSALSKVRKSYCASKLSAIEKKMESFVSNKGHTIRSVLKRSFHKVVLDYLVIGNELILEPDPVKSKVNEIMEGWTQKRGIPLDHVFDGAFFDVMSCMSFDELFGVISNLPNGKAAGLSGISNEFWKHYDILVLGMLLVLINSCLSGILTNTCLIALIKMAWKILSKILSNKISLACSKFDVLHEDNFSVLKGTTTQFLIFAIGSVVKDALEKNWKLWLVLQDMRKTYDLFIWFFGGIHGSCTNRVMTDFELTDGYCVHDGLDQGEVFLPLLWDIFYDPLLCKVKRQESVCDYRLNSHFVAKTGRVESQAGSTSFFAAGAFVDNMIWIGSSQVATQYILNIASEFFRINDISINNDKTVAIPINCKVANPSLLISDAPILVAKKGKSHCYLGIFLSTEGLDCSLSLSDAGPSAFWFYNGTLMSLVLGESNFSKCLPSLQQYGIAFVEQLCGCESSVLEWVIFKCWKKLDPRGPIPECVLNSIEFGLVCDHLSGLGAGCISVYTDSSLSGLGSVNMRSGAAVFFDDINMGMGVKVLSLMLSTLAELQVIALVLECIPVSSSVNLFSDSQVALNACRSELMERHYIVNLVCSKRLKITWHKVKDHSGNFGNDHVDELAGHAASSNLILSLQLDERYILAGSNIVSDNSKHFVCNVFYSIYCLCWKYGSSTNVVTQDLLVDIDWWRSASVWYSDLHMAAGPTSKHTAGICTYFMKALHYRLPVAVRKHFYDRGYPSVICLFCGCVEVSDHVFSCDADAAICVCLLKNYATIWENISSLHHSISSVLQFLFSCVLNTSFRIALCKEFVFKKWFYEAVSMFGDSKSAGVKVVTFVCALSFIEKHNLIPRDGSLPDSKSGLSFVYSAGVIRLLSIDVALGISFGFRRFSLFISNAFDAVSVSISA